MATSPLSVVIQNLLADLRPEGEGMTDGELLARFLSSRDDDALAALVRRHAPMVWGVCCRLINRHEDAEDAFQATFLVLVRKVSDVPRGAVANWLYGVARQTAVRVRATAAKQGRREMQVANMPEPTVPEVCDPDLPQLVDEALSLLPDHYRAVVVLCDLEGMTRKAAAQQLGIPEGSVASRLTRARAMLAKRLAQRGVVFSGPVAAVLSAGAAPPALVASTIKVASLLAAGQAAGVVSVKVAALTEGVLKAMLFSKLKTTAALLAVVLLMAGGGWVTGLIAQDTGDRTAQIRRTPDNQPAITEARFALDANGGKGKPYLLPPDAGNDNHLWQLRKVGDEYMIVSKVGDMALDGFDPKAYPRLTKSDLPRPTQSMLWEFRKAGDYYMIVTLPRTRPAPGVVGKPKAAEKGPVVLDAAGGKNKLYFNQPDPTNINHLWQLKESGNYHMIVSKVGGLALDAAGGRDTPYLLKPDPANINHLWKITQIDDLFVIQSRVDDLALDAAGGDGFPRLSKPDATNNDQLWQLKKEGEWYMLVPFSRGFIPEGRPHPPVILRPPGERVGKQVARPGAELSPGNQKK